MFMWNRSALLILSTLISACAASTVTVTSPDGFFTALLDQSVTVIRVKDDLKLDRKFWPATPRHRTAYGLDDLVAFPVLVERSLVITSHPSLGRHAEIDFDYMGNRVTLGLRQILYLDGLKLKRVSRGTHAQLQVPFFIPGDKGAVVLKDVVSTVAVNSSNTLGYLTHLRSSPRVDRVVVDEGIRFNNVESSQDLWGSLNDVFDDKEQSISIVWNEQCLEERNSPCPNGGLLSNDLTMIVSTPIYDDLGRQVGVHSSALAHKNSLFIAEVAEDLAPPGNTKAKKAVATGTVRPVADLRELLLDPNISDSYVSSDLSFSTSGWPTVAGTFESSVEVNRDVTIKGLPALSVQGRRPIVDMNYVEGGIRVGEGARIKFADLILTRTSRDELHPYNFPFTALTKHRNRGTVVIENSVVEIPVAASAVDSMVGLFADVLQPLSLHEMHQFPRKVRVGDASMGTDPRDLIELCGRKSCKQLLIAKCVAVKHNQMASCEEGHEGMKSMAAKSKEMDHTANPRSMVPFVFYVNTVFIVTSNDKHTPLTEEEALLERGIKIVGDEHSFRSALEDPAISELWLKNNIGFTLDTWAANEKDIVRVKRDITIRSHPDIPVTASIDLDFMEARVFVSGLLHIQGVRLTSVGRQGQLLTPLPFFQLEKRARIRLTDVLSSVTFDGNSLKKKDLLKGFGKCSPLKKPGTPTQAYHAKMLSPSDCTALDMVGCPDNAISFKSAVCKVTNGGSQGSKAGKATLEAVNSFIVGVDITKRPLLDRQDRAQLTSSPDAEVTDSINDGDLEANFVKRGSGFWEQDWVGPAVICLLSIVPAVLVALAVLGWSLRRALKQKCGCKGGSKSSLKSPRGLQNTPNSPEKQNSVGSLEPQKSIAFFSVKELNPTVPLFDLNQSCDSMTNPSFSGWVAGEASEDGTLIATGTDQADQLDHQNDQPDLGQQAEEPQGAVQSQQQH